MPLGLSALFGAGPVRADEVVEGNATESGSQRHVSGSLVVGSHKDGRLSIIQGAKLFVDDSGAVAIVSGEGGASGTLVINGGGSALDVRNDFSVGLYGAGNLEIAAGGLLTDRGAVLGVYKGSSGTATVSDAGSQWLNRDQLLIGLAGNGTLAIKNGGVVSSVSDSWLGYYPGVSGTVSVTGAGSTWTLSSGDIMVGYGGTGTLGIADGGKVAESGTYSAEDENGVSSEIPSGATIGYGAGTSGTVTVTGKDSAWTMPGDLSVGFLGSGTLRVEDGAKLSNAATLVGFSFQDMSNSGDAVVSGPGSTWTSDGNFFVAVGSKARGGLGVYDGAVLTSGPAYLGYTAGSTAGVGVSGNGSTWKIGGDLDVAKDGQATLTISDHGTVQVNGGKGTVFVADNAGSVGSIIIGAFPGKDPVAGGTLDAGRILFGSGTGELIFNHTDKDLVFHPDVEGAGNIKFYSGKTELTGKVTASADTTVSGTDIVLSGGGVLKDREGFIADGIGGQGTVRVTGAGSAWQNSGNLYVGLNGPGYLNVDAGGLVEDNIGYVGYQHVALGQVVVQGSGSRWNNADSVYVGFGGTGTLILVEDATVSVANGGGVIHVALKPEGTGTINIGAPAGTEPDAPGILLAKTVSFDAGDAALVFNHTRSNYVFAPEIMGHGRVDIFAGKTELTGNSTYTGNTTLYGGALLIDGGNIVSDGAGLIGAAKGKSANVTVAGQGSGWTHTGELQVGGSGDGSLTIASGAKVEDGKASVGAGQGVAGTVTITGQDSVWKTGGDVQIAGAGTGTVRIEDKAKLQDSNALLAAAKGSVATATVSGGGASWENSDAIRLAISGSAELNVAKGGIVRSKTAVLGAESEGSGLADINGAGSLWTTSGDMHVGEAGSGRLIVERGGTVRNDGAVLAVAIGSKGSATVQDDGSVWDAGKQLLVGNYGTGGLLVADHGVVKDEAAGIAQQAGGSGVVKVTGAGSTWTTSGTLQVGGEGSATLGIEAAGRVEAAQGSVADKAGSKADITVTGKDSALATSGDLIVGNAGTATLTVDVAGALKDRSISIGAEKTGIGTITIQGDGSTWDNGGNVIIGDSGTANVIVKAGAKASATLDTGSARGAGSRGTLQVTGAGSSWTGAGRMIVGYGGQGKLSVEDGGSIAGTSGSIGHLAGATGDATVTGAGSAWQAGDSLIVGNGGSGTLRLANGGTVNVGNGGGAVTIARQSGSSGTLVIGDQVGHSPSAPGKLAAGSIVFGDGSGSIVLNHDSVDFTLAAAISGKGQLGLYSGTTKLTGKSDFAGDTDVHGGTLSLASGGSLADENGALAGVSSDNAKASVGSGSSWTNRGKLVVGSAGTGNLNIDGGGKVSDSEGRIGDNADAVGSATIVGTGSSWSNGDQFVVGVAGKGSLAIKDGAAVTDNRAGVGYSAGGTGNVSVSGSGAAWITTSALDIGVSGTGTLGVDSGGKVEDADGVIGYFAGSNGTVAVAGAGSVWASSGTTAVGYEGSGALAVQAGGAVTDANGFVGYNAGSRGAASVSGPGSRWDSSGRLVVGGAGSGTLLVDGGGVVTSTGGLIGFQASATGRALVNGAGTAWRSSGNFSIGSAGSGSLTLAAGGAASAADGSGTVTIGEAAGSVGRLNIGAAASDAAAAPGSLAAAAVQFGAGDAALVFNHNGDDYSFATKITGTGHVDVYSGTTKLTAANDYSGGTNIYGGKLIVNGSITGSVNLAGGALGGSGNLGALSVNSGSTVAPGNSIGTLNVSSITLKSGSTYAAEFTSDGRSDLIASSGTATIESGVSLKIGPEHGVGDGSTWAPSTKYVILNAAGGLSGTFTTVSDDFAFLDPKVSYDANKVYVELDRTDAVPDFGGATDSPNGGEAAGAVQNLDPGSALYKAVLMLRTAEAPNAFEQLSGEIHASARATLLDGGRYLREAALERLGTAEQGTRPAIWAHGTLAWGQARGGGAAALSRDSDSLFVGADAASGAWRGGVLGGYTRSKATTGTIASHARATSWELGLYAGGQWGGTGLRLGGAYAWQRLHTQRAVAFTGFSDLDLANYQARRWQAFGEAGQSVALGGLELEPFAGLAYVRLTTGAFQERGSGAALRGARQREAVAFSSLGARLHLRLGERFDLRGSAAWQHAFGNVEPSARLALAGGGAFTATGTPIARDAAALQLDAALRIAPNASLGIGYSGEIGGHFHDHAARATLALRF